MSQRVPAVLPLLPRACRSCRVPRAPLQRAPRVGPPAARLPVPRVNALRSLAQRPRTPSSLRAQRLRPAPTQCPCLLSQYNPIVLRYKLSPASLLYCNMIASPSNCIAIHLPPKPTTSLSQYTLLYCDTISLNQTSHLLQYTRCIAIQFLPYPTSTISL